MKTILSLAFGAALLTSAPAISSELSMYAFIRQTSQERVAVKPEDLPEKVRDAFNTKSYTDWEIEEAFLVTEDNGAQYYELSVRKADERSRIKITKEGQVMN